MSVSDTHIDYDNATPKWTITTDCIKGSNSVKAQKTLYLPKPNSTDKSKENDERYHAYLTRANYVNYTGQTKGVAIGMAFRVDPVYEIPAKIDYIIKNSDGKGLNLNQAIKEILGSQLGTGRHGLLVDHPSNDNVPSKGNTSILHYGALDILNWRIGLIDNELKLILVVLKERKEIVDSDGFGSTFEDQYRVLRLNEGIYTQEIYNDNDDFVIANTPVKWNGEYWDTIPFQFIGAENNSESVDIIPLYSIAEINISHYRNSADYEESSFMVGQPTPYATGLNENWVTETLKGQVNLGSRGFIPLPENATMGLLQANENQMPMKGMEMKEAQMTKVGARLILDNSGKETAEAARIRLSGQNGNLTTMIGNCEEGLEQSLLWVSEFMMESPIESTVTINRQFSDYTLTDNQVMSMIQLSDIGAMDAEDISKNLKRAGWVDSEKEVAEIKQSNDDAGSGLINLDDI